jgi:small subunit ribosomal protein S10
MRYWCLNCALDAGQKAGDESIILTHCLEQNLWAMQYQYAHNSHDYQDNALQRGTIVRNWDAIAEIQPGDWCAAWMPSGMFYAIGRVIKPRRAAALHDRVDRTLSERRHIHLDGIVHYTDAAGAFYECFTAAFVVQYNRADRCHYCRDHPDESEVMKFPQRIDVEEWENIVRSGVPVSGLQGAAKCNLRGAAIVSVDDQFFQRIRTALQQASPSPPSPSKRRQSRSSERIRIQKQSSSSERIRIHMEAYDHEVLDRTAREIVDTAERTGAIVLGPIPLPTRVERYTVLRSPDIGRKSREQFEIRTHKRLLDLLHPTPKTIEALDKGLNLPPGVDIKVRVLPG